MTTDRGVGGGGGDAGPGGACRGRLGRRSALAGGLLALTAAAQAEAPLTEADYYAPLPQVLTVTRLAQPLDDVPGAVTVIDRDTIRRTPARDVTDLLRLVPGYMVGGFSGANVTAAYHMPLDEYGQRNLVLVDGRSIYSSGYLGGTMRGLMTVTTTSSASRFCAAPTPQPMARTRSLASSTSSRATPPTWSGAAWPSRSATTASAT